MPLVINLSKFWRAFRGYGPVTPNEGELGRIVVPTQGLHLMMAEEFLVTDGALSGVQAADSLVASIQLTQESQVGWWLCMATWTFTAGNSQHVRILRGVPVLGTLLAVGAKIDYDMHFRLQGDLVDPIWMEPFLLHAPINTMWAAHITAAMIAGDSIRCNLHAFKCYVD